MLLSLWHLSLRLFCTHFTSICADWELNKWSGWPLRQGILFLFPHEHTDDLPFLLCSHNLGPVQDAKVREEMVPAAFRPISALASGLKLQSCSWAFVLNFWLLCQSRWGLMLSLTLFSLLVSQRHSYPQFLSLCSNEDVKRFWGRSGESGTLSS